MARGAKPVNFCVTDVPENRSTTTWASVTARIHCLILPATQKLLIKRMRWLLEYECDRSKQFDFQLLVGTLLHNRLPSEKR